MDAVSALRRLKRATASARAAERYALEALAKVIHDGHVTEDPQARLFCSAVAEYVECEEFIATMYRRLAKMCRARRWAPHVDLLRRSGVVEITASPHEGGDEDEDPDWYPPLPNTVARPTSSAPREAPPG